jgi:hypothetical protein
MLQQGTIGDRILEMARASPDCTFEEVTQELPELHWYDVFREVERLSHSGHMRVVFNRLLFMSTLRLP